MTSVQQRGWEQFFELVREVKAQLDVDRLDVTDSNAEAQVGGTYEGGRWSIVEIR